MSNVDGVDKRINFQPGDMVELVKTFRCKGDTPETDRDIDRTLRATSEGNPVGVVQDSTDLTVLFESESYGYPLYVDNDRLALVSPPASDEEIEAAIRSIMGGA